MSDADSKRRQRNNPASQRPPRRPAGNRPLPLPPRDRPLPPPPRPLAKSIEFADDFPELRPRVGSVMQSSITRPKQRLVLGSDFDSPYPKRPTPLAETAADLDRAKMLSTRAAPLPLRSSFPTAAPRRWLPDLFGSPWLVLLVGAVCLGIYLLASTPSKVTFSNYVNWDGARQAQNIGPAPVAPGEHSVVGPPSISADDVEAVLRKYNSPAVGTGPAWIELGQKYGIDPAYALAFFIHESTAGTNPGWAGLKPGGTSTHNIGNIICAGYSSCFGRFRDYASWNEGIEDWYKLIANEYIGGRGIQTVEQIIPIYAPAIENNVNAYINAVVSTVEEWRRNGVPR